MGYANHKGFKTRDTSNYAQLDDDGVLTFAGTAKRSIRLRPSLNYNTITAQGKPTAVTVGANKGYSLPIYNNDNEELFITQLVPFRWDGTTDPVMGITIGLGGAEDVGDSFKLQVSISTTSCGDKFDTTTTDVVVETEVLADRNEQYDCYCIEFTLDADDADNPLTAGDPLAIRLRRLAADGTEVDGEIIVFDWFTKWCRDKLGSTWS